MTAPENRTAEQEHQEHRYVGNYIPWYIHLLWLSFWIVAILYIFTYLVPAMRTEIVTPP
jgi:hypothetical protein